jgi:diguanylate cyclase (GGDEF)-like protein/PAS domain S-box-containing protein
MDQHDTSGPQDASLAALYARLELAEMTLASIGDAVLTTDADGLVLGLNRAAEQITGWSSAEANRQPVEKILPIVDELSGTALENPVLHSLRVGRTVSIPNRSALVTRNGERVAIEDTAAPIRNPAGVILGVVVVLRDVSHERQLRHELSWQASHDALTGLINRREFAFQVAAALDSATSDNAVHALLYLDLDQFKLVNDTCGHGAGDVLLQHLAGLLQSHLRDTDVLARLGGDELGVLLRNCRPRQALALADKLRRAVKDYRFSWGGNTFEVGASVGLITIDGDSRSVSELLAAADQACYIAKQRGRNRVHVHQETGLDAAERHGDVPWLARLNDALEHGGFRLLVLPARRLAGPGTVAGLDFAEVLLRMTGKRGRMILPGAFLPAAERYDLSQAVDRWVIEATCAALCTHGQTHPKRAPPTLSVNLSASSLNQPDMQDFILDAFARYGTQPSQICFEFTESAALANIAEARRFMSRLQAVGVRFALDDFGSGLSSFAYLKTLPVDLLKIDGLFVRDLATSAINRAMVAAINEVGHVMGMQTIAEFVETADALAVVQAIGVDYAQGFAAGTLAPLSVYLQ